MACAVHPKRHMLKKPSGCSCAPVASRVACGHVMTTVSKAKNPAALTKRTTGSGPFPVDADHLLETKRGSRRPPALAEPVVEPHVPLLVNAFRKMHEDRGRLERLLSGNVEIVGGH